jgi:hypothetical protein
MIEPRRYVATGPFDRSSNEFRKTHLWAYDARDAAFQAGIIFHHFDSNLMKYVPGVVTGVEPWDEKIHGQWIGPSGVMR